MLLSLRLHASISFAFFTSATHAEKLRITSTPPVRQGESVFAIGNPSGAMQFSMTKGMVSAVGRFREAGAGTWIQTDTPISHNSTVRRQI